MARLSPLLKQSSSVVVDHGEGAYLYGIDGRRYLDFTAGIGVTSTGHCHPRVVAAAREQLGKLVHGQFTTVLHQPLLKLTERLGEVLPAGLDSLFFANSGSEAVEAALRLARQSTGRPNIIVFQGGFHGRTLASATMTTSSTRFSAGISPLMGGVHIAPFPDNYRYGSSYGWDSAATTDFVLRELDYLFATVSAPEETAAFLVEPVLGEGGYVPANAEFFAGLHARARRHGILLMIDEVQTGFGRTGRFWGHQHFTAEPDVLIIAKGLASGFPLSAIAAPNELMGKAFPGSQGGTYGGNAVSCAAAIATLEVIQDEGLVENAKVRGEQLIKGAREIARQTSNTKNGSKITDVRGLGLMVGSEFKTDEGNPDSATAHAVQKAAEERGLLLLVCGPYFNVVRMIPPLIVNEEQVEQGLSLWSEAVSSQLTS
jgi:4-aminobutyrate aminotransferase